MKRAKGKAPAWNPMGDKFRDRRFHRGNRRGPLQGYADSKKIPKTFFTAYRRYLPEVPHRRYLPEVSGQIPWQRGNGRRPGKVGCHAGSRDCGKVAGRGRGGGMLPPLPGFSRR
jgi:hypothetical protein